MKTTPSQNTPKTDPEPGKPKLPRTAWKPGQSGNPGGRPKSKESFGDIARAMLDGNRIQVTVTDDMGRHNRIDISTKQSFKHVIVANLLRKAMSAGPQSLQAATELWNRLDGKPAETLSVLEGQNEPVTLTIVDARKTDKTAT